MQDSSVLKEFEDIVKKAKRIVEDLEKKVEAFEMRLKLLRKEMLIEDMRKRFDKIQTKTFGLRLLSLLPPYRNTEIWVKATREESDKSFTFGVTTFVKDFIPYIKPIIIEKEESRTRYAPLEVFEKRFEAIMSLIQKGEPEDLLKMEADEILWEIMGQSGKLIPLAEKELSSILEKSKKAQSFQPIERT